MLQRTIPHSSWTWLYTPAMGSTDILEALMVMVVVNGETAELPDNTGLQSLINDHLQNRVSSYAVAVNGEVLPRTQIESYVVASGDTIEIVQAMGGG